MQRLPLKRKILLATGTLLVALILGGLFFFLSEKAPTTLMQAARDSTFPIYQAHALPNGFTLDESSVSLTPQVLIMSAKNDSGAIISITETPVPKDFDYESFYEQRLTGVQDAQSIYGRAKVGILDTAMSGSLVTDSTWVLVKGPQDLPAKDMKKLVESLRPIQ